MNYLTNCVNSDGRSINEMVDRAREITNTTFRRKVSESQLREVFPGYSWGPERGLHLKDDYCVRYYKSKYRGRACYFMDHSAIEYIFV